MGICVVGGALILAGAIAGAGAFGAKNHGTQALQQPMLAFLTEFDAADYLGVSLNELDYMREHGMLAGAFLPVTSLEQTGEEEYYDIVDGLEVVKVRPVMSNVTRYLFHRELLDRKVLEMMKDGRNLNTSEESARRRSKKKPAAKTESPITVISSDSDDTDEKKPAVKIESAPKTSDVGEDDE